MNISVVLCTYNRAESLRRTLCSLSAMRVPANLQWEVLVVDNNSSDHTRDVTEMAGGQLPCRYLFEGRQGKSFALNTAIPQARGEIVAFTDDDVQLDRGWLVEIKRAFELFDCIGIGGKIIPVWNCEKPRWLEEEGPYKLAAAIVRLDLGEEACELQQPAFGANMAFRRTAFEKYGLFKENLGPNPRNMIRGEDSEFSWRVIQGGEKLMYGPRVVVYHPVDEKRTTKKYFVSWYFNYGRALVRANGVPLQAIRYFGVPRYLFRQFGKEFLKWTCCLQSKRRFYYKLQVSFNAGAIVESRARSISSKL